MEIWRRHRGLITLSWNNLFSYINVLVLAAFVIILHFKYPTNVQCPASIQVDGVLTTGPWGMDHVMTCRRIVYCIPQYVVVIPSKFPQQGRVVALVRYTFAFDRLLLNIEWQFSVNFSNILSSEFIYILRIKTRICRILWHFVKVRHLLS